MADTGLVVTKVGQSIISKLMPKFANRLLKWAVPLNEEHVIVRFEQAPYICIHHDPGAYEMVLVFQINNLTPYKIEFHKYDCKIELSSNPFFHVNESEYFVLKQHEKKRVSLIHQLTPSEIKKAEAQSNQGHNAFYAQYTFSFTVNTRFGPQAIKPETLCSVITISKNGEPKA